MTTLFYLFVFVTWGIGLLCLLGALSNYILTEDLKRKERNIELLHKTQLFDKINALTEAKTQGFAAIGSNFPAINPPPTHELPDKVKELMKSSPNHPEVNEIDGSDTILGVRFGAENYPPGFGEGDE